MASVRVVALPAQPEIGMATIGVRVGAGGLGRFLFLGLKTQDYAQMLAASLLVVALALVVDVAFATIQRLASPARFR